jgi:hypothetical protein
VIPLGTLTWRTLGGVARIVICKTISSLDRGNTHTFVLWTKIISLRKADCETAVNPQPSVRLTSLREVREYSDGQRTGADESPFPCVGC